MLPWDFILHELPNGNSILGERRATTGPTYRMTSEDKLIERIARAMPSRGTDVTSEVKLRLGIGDDAAVVAPGTRSEWVLSCDASMDGVHFLASGYPADSVGFKSLIRATSDLAAMGSTPRFFMLTLALPASHLGAWLDEFLRGMGRAARRLGMRLIGGDTTKSQAVFISIMVLGEIAPGLAIPRSGARPGDVIYVSGRLGAAQLGLELVKNGALRTPKRGTKSQLGLLKPHLYPQIRVGLGSWLAQRQVASAMMDISDGLSTDLARLCAASGAGSRIWADRIPCVRIPAGATSGKLRRRLAKLKLDPLRLALHGGEDYELLFTVSPNNEKKLRRAPGFSETTAIGEIERGKNVVLVDANGKAKRLVPGGWDPFHRK